MQVGIGCGVEADIRRRQKRKVLVLGDGKSQGDSLRLPAKGPGGPDGFPERFIDIPVGGL
jgi:hypothetical protein